MAGIWAALFGIMAVSYPVQMAVFGLLMIVALIGLGVWIIKKTAKSQKEKLWSWEEVKLDKSAKDDDKSSLMTRITVWGILEIRNIPTKWVWVVRHGVANQAGEDENLVVGKTSGWRMIFLPSIKWFTMKMVNTNPVNLDLDKIEVNTKSLPVKVDTQITYQVSDAERFAVNCKQNIAELIEEFVGSALNLECSDKTDVELQNLSKNDKDQLSKSITDQINKEDASTSPTGLSIYGIKAIKLRLQSIELQQGMTDAKGREEEAASDSEAMKKLAIGIQTMKNAAGMPDESPFNALLPLAVIATQFFGSRKGFSFSSGNKDKNKGGNNKEEKKEEGEKKPTETKPKKEKVT